MSDLRSSTWPDYRAVWRWHFYAGLFCIPFVIVLSISGAIYLFKPQIEAWCDREFDSITVHGAPTTPTEQVHAALAAIPGSTPQSYELPRTPTSAVRVIVRKDGLATRVYLHPESLAILQMVREDERFMRSMFRLHGELWMGDRGSNLVELASSWAIIMIVTGLYLWWPRNAKGLGGVLYPRLRMGTGILWRDLHSVVGMWISAGTLFLLLTGLPWAKFWGNYFKEVRQLTGTSVAQQDWTTGRERSGSTTAQRDSRNEQTSRGEHAGHGGSERHRGAGRMPKDLTAFDRVVTAVKPLNLEYPVVIAPPSNADSDEWTAKSMTQNRPLRVNLVVSGKSGEVIHREDFTDRHIIDQIVGACIAAHEGQLFGWPNQLLGLLTALGLVLLCVSGVVMWWRRREVGVLGAPKVLLNPCWSWSLVGLVLLLGIYLPLFGASLVLVVIIEIAVLRRIPLVRTWLGLTPVT